MWHKDISKTIQYGHEYPSTPSYMFFIGKKVPKPVYEIQKHSIDHEDLKISDVVLSMGSKLSRFVDMELRMLKQFFCPYCRTIPTQDQIEDELSFYCQC